MQVNNRALASELWSVDLMDKRDIDIGARGSRSGAVKAIEEIDM